MVNKILHKFVRILDFCIYSGNRKAFNRELPELLAAILLAGFVSSLIYFTFTKSPWAAASGTLFILLVGLLTKPFTNLITKLNWLLVAVLTQLFAFYATLLFGYFYLSIFARVENLEILNFFAVFFALCLGILKYVTKFPRNSDSLITYPAIPFFTNQRIREETNSTSGTSKSIELLSQKISYEQPLVTVIVPAYNASSFISDALESLLKQTLSRWECIIVDDFSTDSTLDIIAKYLSKDSRFKCITHSQNLGLAASRNSGIWSAAGPYVTFLDADDFFLPNALESRLAALTFGEHEAGSYSDWDSPLFSEANLSWRPNRKPRARAEYLDILNSPWSTPFIATSPILRIDLVRRIGGFNEDLRSGEDIDFFGRILRSGWHFTYSHTLDVVYRQRPDSLIQLQVGDHTAAAAGAIRWRNQAWPEGKLTSENAFTLPLKDYVAEQAIFDRVISNYTIGLLAKADREQLDSIRIELETLSAQVRNRPGVHESIDKFIMRSWKRLHPEEDIPTRLRDSVFTQCFSELGLVRPESSYIPISLGCDPLERTWHYQVPREISIKDRPFTTDTFLITTDSRYHVFESGPLYKELIKEGIDAVPVLSSAGNVDRAALIDWGRFADHVVTCTPEELMDISLAGCFVLNDWSPTAKILIDRCRESKGTSFAKVEGVQDFKDIDTGRVRNPYLNADVVLAQGNHDLHELNRDEVHLVGSSRLERMISQPIKRNPQAPILVNLNFTYNVMTEHQIPWITQVMDTLDSLNLRYKISAHAAQKGLPTEKRFKQALTSEPFRHEIRNASCLITRFSTVPFESIARGIPFVYFNPHGERVPDFQDGQGQFWVARSGDELISSLNEIKAVSPDFDFRSHASKFFASHVSMIEKSSELRAAGVIIEKLNLGQTFQESAK